MKTSFVFVASFLLAIGCGDEENIFVSSQNHGHVLPDDELAREIFKRMDSNKDGSLAFEEMKQVFVSMDLDVDGHVTKTEFLTLWLANNLGHANYAMNIFARADTNGDGMLDLVDIRRFYSYFDRNGDKKVNDAEFVTTWISLELAF